jgi:hypothetical protein
MTGTLCAAFVAWAALFAVSGAQAKAPPNGVDICGADGACIHLTMEQARAELGTVELGKRAVGLARRRRTLPPRPLALAR